MVRLYNFRKYETLQIYLLHTFYTYNQVKKQVSSEFRMQRINACLKRNLKMEMLWTKDGLQ